MISGSVNILHLEIRVVPKRTRILLSWFGPLLVATTLSAQSGGPPRPANVPPVQSPSKPEPSVTERNPPTYKLILSQTAGAKNFIEELNNAGRQGYRFKSAVFDWPVYPGQEYRGPATLLKLDEGKYEYAFFEIRTGSFYDKPGFDEKYDDFAKRGFHLVDHFRVAGGCDFIDNDNYASGMTCDITYMFLLERLVGGRPVEFLMVHDASTERPSHSASIAAIINAKQAEGFFPVNIVSRMQILLEKINPYDQLPGEKPELELVSASAGRLNDLGKRGYRVGMLFDERALMYRNSTADPPRRYRFVEAKSSDIQNKLLAVQERGAVYQTLYRDDHLSGDKLVFEEPVVFRGTPLHEYKVLRVEFVGEYGGRVELSAKGREAMRTFKQFTTSGFLPCALYRTGKHFTIGILLEH